MNKDEIRIEKYKIDGYYNTKLKVYKTNLDREFCKLGKDQLRLIKDKETLILETETEQIIRLEQENKKYFIPLKEEPKDKNDLMKGLLKELRNIHTELKIIGENTRIVKELDKVENLESNEKIEINIIETEDNNEDILSDTNSITYTELMEEITNGVNNINMNEEKPKTEKTDQPSVSGTKSEHEYKKKPEYYRYTYEEPRRNKKLWENRLSSKYIPSESKTDNNIIGMLDLDCTIDITKEIEKWVGIIAKQLIDNKITITETPSYIERSFTGTVKLWFENLSEEIKLTFRKAIDRTGNPTGRNIDILEKYEMAIKGEFSNLNSEPGLITKEKQRAKLSLIDIVICDMCYMEEYICAYKDYYYKAKLNEEEKKQFNNLFYNKLPYPFNEEIIVEFEKKPRTDTLGVRIEYLRDWFRDKCDDYKKFKRIKKSLENNIKCCSKYEVPKLGCSKRYPKRKTKKIKPTKYKFRNTKKRNYVTNKKRQERYKKDPSKCKCYNCGKFGHIAKDCKLPKKTTINEIENDEFINIEILNVEYINLSDSDTIYESGSDSELSQTSSDE